MLDNETTSSLLAVAEAYVNAGKSIPEYVLADLALAANCDEIAQVLRHRCRLLSWVSA